MQPNEETDSAEDQPASNMAAPTLETVGLQEPSPQRRFHIFRRAVPLRKPTPVEKQSLVEGAYCILYLLYMDLILAISICRVDKVVPLLIGFGGRVFMPTLHCGTCRCGRHPLRYCC